MSAPDSVTGTYYHMNKIISIEPAIDPNARPTFLLDWELTLKCNLDCSYCPSEGPYRAHDNKELHPDLADCLETIDFMFEYVDAYMKYKPRWSKMVVLNVYGGESLFHPDIETVFKAVKEKHTRYQDRWPLTVTCTTNAVIGKNRLGAVMDHIDEFTVSYHCETLPKQKQQILDNLDHLQRSGKRLKCIVLMHGDQSHWPELMDVIEFCKNKNISYLPKQLDGEVNSNYNSSQIKWFQSIWDKRTPEKSRSLQEKIMEHKNLGEQDTKLSHVGRACCGGRLMCANGDLDHRIFYIPDNDFRGWKCSVNWFFLFIRQSTKEIFTNKDCRMNFDGTVSPIGHLDQWKELVDSTRRNLEIKSMPTITCAVPRCRCGLCAPKADNSEGFLNIMKKHTTESVLLG